MLAYAYAQSCMFELYVPVVSYLQNNVSMYNLLLYKIVLITWILEI